MTVNYWEIVSSNNMSIITKTLPRDSTVYLHVAVTYSVLLRPPTKNQLCHGRRLLQQPDAVENQLPRVDEVGDES